jgi:hypothetical protein
MRHCRPLIILFSVVSLLVIIGTIRLIVYIHWHLHMRINTIQAIDAETGQFLAFDCNADHSIDGIDDWMGWYWGGWAPDARPPIKLWKVDWNVPFTDYPALAHGFPVIVKSPGYEDREIYLDDQSPSSITVPLHKKTASVILPATDKSAASNDSSPR